MLTTQLGVLESGRTGFVQDATAGIALYLEAATTGGLVAGTTVTATGVVDERYGQRTLRVNESAVQAVGSGALPDARSVQTGVAGESIEGSRVAVAGLVVEAPSALSDGLGLMINDGTGPLRIVVTPAALGSQVVVRGGSVIAIGPLGQRDSSGTGLAGYRVFASLPGELVVVPTVEPSPSPEPTLPPSPTPEPSILPSPAPSTGPTPTPTPAPTPTPTPTPGPTSEPVLAIAEARLMPVGSVVTIRGVVTAEAGRVGTPPLFAIQDPTAGLLVHRPEAMAGPARGTFLEVTGKLAEPNGQLEVRPETSASISTLGPSVMPSALAILATQLGEATEARLVVVEGLLIETPSKASSGDLTTYLQDSTGMRVRVMADATSGIAKPDLAKGRSYRLTGVVGQRASRRGALDGYRIWIRDRQDISLLAGGGSGGSSSGSTVSIAHALVGGRGPITVEGTVTAGPALLDASGRRIVIQDSSAAVEVRLPADSSAPRVGQRLRIAGTMGRAYGAPRLTAEQIVRLTSGAGVQPLELRSAPGTAHEWRLVRLVGLYTPLMQGWLRRASLPPSDVDDLVQEVLAVVVRKVPGFRHDVGIVRRPYPSAKDRRFAIVPRSAADLTMGAATPGIAGEGSASGAGSSVASGGAGYGLGPTSPVDVDLGQLAEHFGGTVRVGGLIESLSAEGVTLDDGTGTALIVLEGDAAGFLPLLRPGEAVNAIGRVEGDRAHPHVLVADGAGLVRVGELGDLPAVAPEPSRAADIPADHQPGGHTAAGALPDLVSAPTGAGLVSLILVSFLSVAVTLLRRRRVRRALAARLAERLAAIKATPSTPWSAGAGPGAGIRARSHGSVVGAETPPSELGPRSG